MKATSLVGIARKLWDIYAAPSKLVGLQADLNEIKSNHLPHIQQDLSYIKGRLDGLAQRLGDTPGPSDR